MKLVVRWAGPGRAGRKDQRAVSWTYCWEFPVSESSPIRSQTSGIEMEGLMDITALGYVGISSAKLDDWSALATGLLGMQQADWAKAVRAFRMDDRKQRLVIDDEGHEGLGFIGFEVADAAALDRVATRIEVVGRPCRGSRSVADERHVADLVVFHDPGGHRIEIFHGAETAASPFVPGAPSRISYGPARHGACGLERRQH